MSGQLYTNNASTTLAAGIASGATSITVASGAGALFASPSGGDWQMVTLTNADGSAIEIVKVTGAAGDVLSIVRAQEGTTALAWATGDQVSARLTAGMLVRLAENKASGTDAIALGVFAAASGQDALAIGKSAQAFSRGSIAIGQATAEREGQLIASAHACIPRDAWTAGYGSQYSAFSESGFSSHFADLGSPPAWSSGHTVMDGDIVAPTTPNGFQYRVYAGSYVSGASNSRTEAAGSEPTWPTVIGDSWGTGSGASQIDYVAANLATGMDETIPPGMVFYPSEIGFICFTHSGVTAAPFISIGTAANPTLLVNNQQLTGITGEAQRHAFTGFKHGITDLRIKLNTAATGSGARFHGRFYARGVFIQTQG